MVRTVLKRDGDVDHRVAGENTVLHCFLRARIHRGDVLARDTAAGDLVLEDVAAAFDRRRLDIDLDLGELAGTTRLLLVGVVDLLDLLGDGLAVGNLRLADVGLDLELATHTVDENLKVKFAHARDDRLTGLLVGAHLERRVLFGQALDGSAELLLVTLGLGLDGDRDNRRREVHGLQHDRLGRITQGVARGRVLQAHHGHDVAGAH